MATISELNIRLGLLSKEFERDLRGLERTLQASAQRLSRLGSELTSVITLPLAGLGIAAIKSAGDIEALRLAMVSTMQDAGRSTEEATAELEALRQASLAPGLDFEQAVKGSIRLQNVGFAAEEARAILVQLANAISLTGGTAEELDGVTRQFAQMIAKGRIMQEDLTIIQENMPAISKAMDEAFGTRSAEKLRELGVTAEDFIKGVTEQFEGLPRVAGGINNALVNLFTGLKQQAARLGEEINRVFNIGDAADGIISKVQALVDAFVNLDDGTKKLIVQMAGLAIVAGPVISVFGAIQNAASATVGIFKGVVSSIRSVSDGFKTFAAASNAGGGIKVLSDEIKTISAASAGGKAGIAGMAGSVLELTKVSQAAKNVELAKSAITPITTAAPAAIGSISKITLAVRTMGAATKAALAATGIGLLVVALGVAVELWQGYSQQVSKAAAVKKSLEQVNKSAAESISAEKVKVTELVGVIKDETASREEKQRALEALQAIAPKEFANLTIEKEKIGDIDKALDSYINNLLRAAKAKSAFARLEEIDKLRQSIAEAAEPTLYQNIVDGLLSGAVAGAAVARSAKTQAENIKILNEQYDAEEKALRDVIKANSDFVSTASGVGGKTKDIGDKAGASAAQIEAAAKKTKLYADALASIRAVAEKGDVLGADLFGEQVNEISNQIERLIEGGFKPYGKEVQSLRAMLVTLREESGKGLISANLTQTTLAELDKIENAIGDVNAAFGPIQIDPPFVDPTVEAIDKVAAALAKIQSPPPLVLKSTTPEVGSVPALPSLEIPKQVVQIETGDAIAGLASLQQAAVAGIETNAEYQGSWERIAEIMTLAGEGLTGFSAAMQMASEMAVEQGDTLAEIALAIGESTAQAAAQTAASFGELANAAVSAAVKIVRAWIQQGVAAAVAKALGGLPFPFNLAAGAVAGAAAATLFNSAIAAIGVPALAEGGVVSGPSVVMVGEYPGAASNPEIVAPESKLTKIFSGELSKAQGPVFSAISHIAGAIQNISAPSYFIEKNQNSANAVSNTKNSTGYESRQDSVTNAVSAISNVANTATAAFSDFSKRHETNTSERSDSTQTTIQKAFSSITNLFEGASSRSAAFSRNTETNDNSSGDTTHTVTIEGDVSSAFAPVNETNETRVSKAITAISNSVSTLLSTVLPDVTSLKIPAFATGGVIKTPTFSRNTETNDNSSGDTTHTVTIEGDVSSAFAPVNETNETRVSKAITAISNSVSTLLSTVVPDFPDLKIPAFATGGVIKTPTFGLLGEYAGAATNPEIIAPEGKLRQIFNEEGGDGGELTATIRGDDLLFLLDKTAKRRGRVI